MPEDRSHLTSVQRSRQGKSIFESADLNRGTIVCMITGMKQSLIDARSLEEHHCCLQKRIDYTPAQYKTLSSPPELYHSQLFAFGSPQCINAPDVLQVNNIPGYTSDDW